MSLTTIAFSHGPLRDFLMQQDQLLADAANRTWAIACEIHDRQTENGGNVNGRRHAEKVEENIWRFLYETNDRSPEKKKNLENLSPVDLYLLSCAACIHDFDKGLHNSILPDNFKHGEGSGEFVYRNWNALSIESQAAAEYIDWIVRIHDYKEEFDEELQKIPDSYTLFNRTGDLWRLATLLKAADTLHMDESRISPLAVPDDSLQGFDRLKQIARGNIHGWRPDGDRIVITVSIKSAEIVKAIGDCARYLTSKEWPPIARNLRSHQFPNVIQIEWRYPPSLRDQLVKEGINSKNNSELTSSRIKSEMLSTHAVTMDLPVSDQPLRLTAVCPEKLSEYLCEVGTLSVIDNPYIEPKLNNLGMLSGAVNRIFIGPANCGKTRAAYEWILYKVGLDAHSWVIIRPESGSIPQDTSKFIVDFEDYYVNHRHQLPPKVILFADEVEFPLPSAQWFARQADGISANAQTLIAFHLSFANRPYTEKSVTFHWLLGHAFAMRYLADTDTDGVSLWHEQAIEAYAELTRRFADDETPAVREQVAKGLVNKSVVLGQLGRDEEAIEAYAELTRHFADDETPAVREQVAKGLVNKGVVLDRLGWDEKAIEAYAELTRRFADDETPAVREQVAKGLVNKGVVLDRLGRDEEAIEAYAELTRRFADDETPAVREQVVKGLSNQANVLTKLWRKSNNERLIADAISVGHHAVQLGLIATILLARWPLQVR